MIVVTSYPGTVVRNGKWNTRAEMPKPMTAVLMEVKELNFVSRKDAKIAKQLRRYNYILTHVDNSLHLCVKSY